ncbi:S-layer homology domain-containing protein, partial [Candidatus Gracilibacteria bacterium]|nr:S-layer homology domain-containing protein [Candidatus Gracilibacteria bacterium]
MKKTLFVLLFSVFFTHSTLAEESTFSDVSNDHPYFAAIESLKNLEIVNGYPDGTFKPDVSVNRAEALKMILGSVGMEIPEIDSAGENKFPDVPSDIWFAKFVILGAERGVVAGNPDGSFAPARQVNKAEFVKMLLGAFEKDVSKHRNLTKNISADTKLSQWFVPYLSYAKTLGVITPTLDNELSPGKLLSRGECAEIIYKMLVLERGGDAQKLIWIAESNLIDLLVDLNNNDIQAALQHADNAIFYANEVLLLLPEDSIAIGAHAISQGFRSLCLAYQAGVNEEYEQTSQHVTAAKDFAQQAYDNAPSSFQSLKEKI